MALTKSFMSAEPKEHVFTLISSPIKKRKSMERVVLSNTAAFGLKT